MKDDKYTKIMALAINQEIERHNYSKSELKKMINALIQVLSNDDTEMAFKILDSLDETIREVK